MTKATWLDENGNPASTPDFDNAVPGQNYLLHRVLKNTGTAPLTSVLFTLERLNDGPLTDWLIVQVGNKTLELDTEYDAGALAPGDSVAVNISLAVPSSASPKVYPAFLRVRATADVPAGLQAGGVGGS